MALRAVHVIASVMAAIAGVAILALMLLAVADISRREALGSSIPGVIEFTEVALVVVVFAGLMCETPRGMSMGGS